MKTLQDYKAEYDALNIKRNLKGDAALKAVLDDPWNIRFVPAAEQTEEICLAAVEKDGDVIKFIHNPSETVKLVAVKQYEDAIQFIYNPSKTVQLAAVKKDGDAIQYIHNPSETVCLAAIENDIYALRYVPEHFFEKETPKEKRTIVVDGVTYKEV